MSRSEPTPLGEKRFEVIWVWCQEARNYGRLYRWLQLVLGSMECGMSADEAAKAAARELGL